MPSGTPTMNRQPSSSPLPQHPRTGRSVPPPRTERKSFNAGRDARRTMPSPPQQTMQPPSPAHSLPPSEQTRSGSSDSTQPSPTTTTTPPMGTNNSGRHAGMGSAPSERKLEHPLHHSHSNQDSRSSGIHPSPSEDTDNISFDNLRKEKRNDSSHYPASRKPSLQRHPEPFPKKSETHSSLTPRKHETTPLRPSSHASLTGSKPPKRKEHEDKSVEGYDSIGRPLGRNHGKRGADKRKRVIPKSVISLDEKQARKLNELERKAHNDNPDSKRFILNARDQKVLDYLVRFRYSGTRHIGHVAGWSESYMKTNRRFKAYQEMGLIDVRQQPMDNLKYVITTSAGTLLSQYNYLGYDDDITVQLSHRNHSLGCAALAAHLLDPHLYMDAPEHDLLGVGDEWGDIRQEIRDGSTKVVAERQYRSALQSLRTNSVGQYKTAVTPEEYRHALLNAYKEIASGTHDGTRVLDNQTPEYWCCDPGYKGEYAWLWVVFGNDVVRLKEHDPSTGAPRHYPIEERALDDKHRPLLSPEDSFVTKDHCPDMVICRERDLETGRPRSIAIELELTAKTTDEYVQTMSAYMSQGGQLLYDKVIWLVVNAALSNQIRKGADKAGAVEGRDYLITPVWSPDVKSNFGNGADMMPGQWQYGKNDEIRGYSVLRDVLGE